MKELQQKEAAVITVEASRDLDSGDEEAALHMMNTYSTQLITSSTLRAERGWDWLAGISVEHRRDVSALLDHSWSS